MSIIQWHDNVYATGIEEIDQQHKKLFELINEAHDCAAKENDSEKIRRIVEKMIDYADEHFSTEEKLMDGYDQAEYHCEKHTAFKAKTQELTETLNKGEPVDPLSIFHFLAEWLSAHILEVDMSFTRTLTAKKK